MLTPKEANELTRLYLLIQSVKDRKTFEIYVRDLSQLFNRIRDRQAGPLRRNAQAVSEQPHL